VLQAFVGPTQNNNLDLIHILQYKEKEYNFF
jgi:hypothetical protein